jgi:hypothetical protein
MGYSFKSILVLRIMNKYLALFEDIISEAENPFSGLKLKKFDAPINGNIEDLQNKLIESFGAEGSMQKDIREKHLKKYYNNEISFSEVTISVFRENFIDAYGYFTSSSSEGFMAIPSSLTKDIDSNNDSNFLLDVSTLILIFDVHKQLNINFTNKFFISPYIIEFIEGTIIDIRFSKSSTLSVDITLEGIRPIFYPDDFHEKRKEYFEELLNWVKANCVPVVIERRVNFHRGFANENDAKLLSKIVIDNCLAIEDGYYLITNDNFILKNFPQISNKIVSPQWFIEKNIDDDSINSFRIFLLKSRYIGIDLNSFIIREQLESSLSGKENFYNQCLINTIPINNPNPNIFEETIIFLKNIYLTLQVSIEHKNRIAQTHFLYLLTGMVGNEELLRLLRLKLFLAFNYLGTYQDFVINEYNRAIQILRGEIR